MKGSVVTATDMFCGAGGSSVGLTQAGIELKIGLNHWDRAIETHSTNFPKAYHECADINQCNPRRYDETHILVASPECTNHSLAKGARRRALAQKDFFKDGKIDPAEERSRATMWDVPRFAEFHRYSIIIVENVVDARYWELWEAWLHAMRLLGYESKTVYFNSMFSHPVPQSRDRMYVVFWRKGMRKPNLDFRPEANCAKHGNVKAIQTWKPNRRAGKYLKQYVYCCPHCQEDVTPFYYCAFNAIDFTLPIQKIGERSRPLKEKTLQRLRIGLERFSGQACVVGNYSPGWVRPVSREAGTVTTRDHQALFTPAFITELGFSHAPGDRATDLTQAMRTQTTRATQGIVVPPFIVNMQASNRASGFEEPLPTVLTGDHKYLAIPPFMVRLRNNCDAGNIFEPVSTVCAGGNHQGLCLPFLFNYNNRNRAQNLNEPAATVLTKEHAALAFAPFIYSYYTRLYGKKAAYAGLDSPVPTVPASEKHAVVFSGEETSNEIPDIEECYFRMLQPSELKATQAFPEDYTITGTKGEQVRQIGGAVPPPTMKMIIERCAEIL